MIRLLIEVSKYGLLVLMVLFTLETFLALHAKDNDTRSLRMRGQLLLMILFDFASFMVLFVQNYDIYVIIIYIGLVAYILIVQLVYRLCYQKASFILINTVCMLLSIGMVIQTRLDVNSALKQLIIASAATFISFFIPIIIRKARGFANLGLLFAIVGILLLLAVFVLAKVTGGGKLSIDIGGITFQFSELVKITFVFFIAGMLHSVKTFKQVAIVTVLAGIHVIILVLSTDLGAALVYFVAYIIMVCVATKKVRYAFIGIGGMATASVAAYKMFEHVRVRVNVWQDPFEDYQGTGYQIVQALFSVCAGGWFGTGLLQGSPDYIPLVQEDFTFAAICEEMGILFAICLILLCMGVFLTIIKIAKKLDNEFYKLIAIGLGTEYAFQVFLTIGGATKMIPMTGITLPFISYGGSSISCTLFMIAIIQGLYILRTDEEILPTEEGYDGETGYLDDKYDEDLKSSDYETNKNKKREAAEDLESKIWKETENSINR